MWEAECVAMHLTATAPHRVRTRIYFLGTHCMKCSRFFNGNRHCWIICPEDILLQSLSQHRNIRCFCLSLYAKKTLCFLFFLKEAVFLSINTKRRANSKNLIPQDKKRFPTTPCMSWGSGTRRMVFIRDYQDDVLQLFLFLFDIKLWTCDTKCKMLQSHIDRRTVNTYKNNQATCLFTIQSKKAYFHQFTFI